MYYVKSNNLEFAQQIGLLAANIASLKTLYGFTDDQVAEAIADAAFMLWVCNEDNIAEAFYHAYTDYTYSVRYAVNDKVVIPIPVISVNSVVPVVVPEGIQARYTQKINQIKANINCSDDLLKKLDVISSVAHKDSQIAKPDPKVTLDGGHPVISFHKYGFAAANLYKDSGTGYGEKAYKTMTTTSYKDLAALPLAGLSQIWKYKMMYLLNDVETGVVSDEISIAVSGQ